MKAKKKEILPVPVSELFVEDGHAATVRLYQPEKKGGGLVIEGDVNDLADRLVGILKQKTMVLR
jgi:electron transfer flavoprotein beta subunit